MRHILVFVLFLSFVPFAFAEQITLSVEQSVYYFTVGETAAIPLEVDNRYSKSITAILQYSITQQITQGGTQISSSNTQSSTLLIDGGNNVLTLDFGISDVPTSFTVDLDLFYTENGEFTVSLDPITIHFVLTESQKNNQQNKIQSTTIQNPNTSSSLGQSTPDNSLDPTQRLQNNQISQDSSALRQQIYEQLEQDNQLNQQFQNQLAADEKFQESHQNLLDQGYEITGGNLNPTSASTGSFEIDYTNEQGQWAKIQGHMTNGTSKIQTQTQSDLERMLDQLKADPAYTKYQEQLLSEGFFENKVEFVPDFNHTTIEVHYTQGNQSAIIFGTFENNDLVRVHLDRDSDLNWLVWMAVFALAAFGLYMFKRSKKQTVQTITIQPSFDHVTVAKNMIKQGKEKFNEKKYKDAYGTVNQALRLFLTHELHLDRQITNENLLVHISGSAYPVTDIQKCFRIASLVEFAKYSPNSEDFDTMTVISENIVSESVK